MFIVLYRWRLKPEFETQFTEAWSEITAYYRETNQSLGSRLHRGNDGVFYSYAQWQSAEHRSTAFENRPDFPSAAKMREAIEENFPETVLEIVSDYLIFPEPTQKP